MISHKPKIFSDYKLEARNEAAGKNGSAPDHGEVRQTTNWCIRQIRLLDMHLPKAFMDSISSRVAMGAVVCR